MRVTILGCGGSTGVPLIGGKWGACDPSNPRNRRLRASILVEDDTTKLLVDTSPDMREQLLASGVDWLDAVLYTHGHADHTHGIDDLRLVNVLRNAPLDIYGDRQTIEQLRERFGYVLEPIRPNAEGRLMFYKPYLVAREITGPFQVKSIPVMPFRQDHGFSTTLGFRFGPLAYSTDVADLDDAAFAALADVKVWVVDCLRREPHKTHSHFDRTMGWIERVKPERAILTHMNETMDYEAVSAMCPRGVEPGYDGMIVEL